METHIHLVVGAAVAVHGLHSDAVVAFDERNGSDQLAGIGAEIEIGKPRPIDQHRDGVAVGDIVNGGAHFHRVAGNECLIGRSRNAHARRLLHFYRFFSTANAHGGLVAAVRIGGPNGDIVVAHQ